MTDSRILFADCTLRDGEQAPGVFFTLEEKLAIAAMLDAAGVDLIDAGMPSVSKEERTDAHRPGRPEPPGPDRRDGPRAAR